MTEEQEIRIREKAAAIIRADCWTPEQRRHLEEIEGCLLLTVRLNHLLERRLAALERGQ